MTWTEAVALVEVLAWPVVTLLAVLLLREKLPLLLGRAKKVAALGVELELHAAKEFSPTWSTSSLGDVRHAIAAKEFSSYAMSLMEEFRGEGSYDYAVVNLGEGKSWLTSRLFIFSTMLQRMRGLRCWVFIRPNEGPRRIYLGHASPHEVRWALARRFPWLEVAYARSCADQESYEIKSTQGALEPWKATQLVQSFLSHIQSSDPPPIGEKDEWIKLPKREENDPDTWERAQWISAKSVSSVIGSALHSSSVFGDLNALNDEQRKALLRSQGDFVALLGNGWTFNGLVDRRTTLEGLSTSVADAAETAA